MKNILIVSLVTLLAITGCAANKRCVSSGESRECQRLKHLFNNLEEENIKTILFFAEDSNEPIDEATFREFEGLILHLAGCCFCKPHPLAKEWTGCNRLECILQYLRNESVQRIAFYGFNRQLFDEDTERPEEWDNPWIEITEPKRIKEVIKILLEAVEKEHDRFVNELSPQKPMQIMTDKHKFIVYFIDYENAIRGIGWTSHELQEQLKE
ncbi:MAG: hypothetical protein JXB29_10600 [Sedimentisphaerales bacterium]|nr:hypothetical protein [Sedimentisphaerales bacterium]